MTRAFKTTVFVLLALLALAACTELKPQTTAQAAPVDYYSVDGPSNLDTSTFPKTPQNVYGDDSNTHRPAPVKATITYNVVKKSIGRRQHFSRDPYGWPKRNPKVTFETSTGTDKGFFWNRSHLIADSLGGDAIPANSVPGTRTQNVGNRKHTGGMQYIERKCVDYLKKHRNVTLYYQVTPNYEGNNTIPTTVTVQALTSDGAIDETVTTYNNLKGFTIDYQTGAVTAENGQD